MILLDILTIALYGAGMWLWGCRTGRSEAVEELLEELSEELEKLKGEEHE